MNEYQELTVWDVIKTVYCWMGGGIGNFGCL